MKQQLKNSLEKDLWKYLQAHDALVQSVEIIHQIHDANRNDRREILRSLWISFFVTYARPFTRNRGLGTIRTLVPPEHRQIHQMVLLARDKLASHSDPEIEFDSGDKVNLVTLRVREGRIIPLRQALYPEAAEIPKFISLAESVRVAIHEHIDALLPGIPGINSMTDGDYVLDFTKPEGRRLQRYRTPLHPVLVRVHHRSQFRRIAGLFWHPRIFSLTL